MTQQKRLKSLFNQFCMMANIPTTATFNHQTKKYSNKYLTLNYNSAYGGYRLDWVLENTGESFFSFSNRFSNKEMVSYLQGLMSGYLLAKEGKTL